MTDETTDDDDPTFREIVATSIEEDGYIVTGGVMAELAMIAVLFLGPEYLRMAVYRVIGKEYRPPTQRMAEAVEPPEADE